MLCDKARARVLARSDRPDTMRQTSPSCRSCCGRTNAAAATARRTSDVLGIFVAQLVFDLNQCSIGGCALGDSLAGEEMNWSWLMTTPKSLAIAAIILGSTAAAFAQGAGIAPNSRNLPPQSAYGLNGYGYPYYGSQYYGLYDYAPRYYRYGYARPFWHYRHWHY